MMAGPSQLLVSVLTPSFNQARWLADNLRSVACQTYPRIEHIVMDGGSGDGSTALLAAAGPKVRWKSEPDNGQSDALNKAFALSNGDIVGWVNSDDAYFDRHVVEDVVAFFERDPGVDVVYGHAACVDSDGRILHFFWAPPFHRRLLRLYDFIVQPTVFCRRRVLGDDLVDEDLDFAMDYGLWLRLSQTARFARFDRVIAIDRVQPGRKSRTMLGALRADSQRLASELGAMDSPAAHCGAAAHHVYCRWRGAGLAVARHGDLAFSVREDRRAAILWRQVGRRRSRMPVGET